MTAPYQLTPKEIKEEKRISDDFENGRYQVLSRTDPAYEKLYAAAGSSQTPVHLRLSEPLIKILKRKAQEEGLSFQSFVRSILHKVASGQLKS